MTLPIVKWRSSLAHSSDQMLNRHVILNEVDNSQNKLEFTTFFIKNSNEMAKMEKEMKKWQMLNESIFEKKLLKKYYKIEYIYKMKIPVYSISKFYSRIELNFQFVFKNVKICSFGQKQAYTKQNLAKFNQK